jgi:hypothetical protein
MADGHPVLNEPVLVRRGLRLDECVTETCLAVKVLKRFASETLKLVGPLRGVSKFVCYFPIFPGTDDGFPQAQSQCPRACEYTRHCKRVRYFDDDHVLVLLGPAHLVPAGFCRAVELLLEPNCSSAGAEFSFCLQVPVVTTVPITQVGPFAINLLARDPLPFM